MNAAAIHDEPPTARIEFPSSARMLVFASRIDRLAELAAERLEVVLAEHALAADAVAAALDDLAAIRDLCRGAMR